VWRTARTLAAHGLDTYTPVRRCLSTDLDEFDQSEADEDTVLVIGGWTYSCREHSVGEAILARTIAHDITEKRRICRQMGRDDELY
jgi:hypothetical protein